LFQATGAVTFDSTTGLPSFNFVVKNPGPQGLPGGSTLQCGGRFSSSGSPTFCERNHGPGSFQLTINYPAGTQTVGGSVLLFNFKAPGPFGITFSGEFQLQVIPGAAPSTFDVQATLTGERAPGPAGVTGTIIIVERDPGPYGAPSTTEFGSYSVSGVLGPDPNDPTGVTQQLTFNLNSPGPQQNTALQSGTSFNILFKNPGPTSFTGNAIVSEGSLTFTIVPFSGSGFVLLVPAVQ